MPPVPNSEPIETVLPALLEALDRVDIAIILLDVTTKVRFVNRRFAEIWREHPGLLETAPGFRALLAHATDDLGCHAQPGQQFSCRDRCGPGVCGDIVRTATIDLKNGRRLLFRCASCADGGRIVTYCDVTPLREEPEQLRQMLARLNAEQRFVSETLEDQASHLASLAETAEENARQATEANRKLTREIARRRELELQLRRMATTDALTGVLNRRQFMTLGQRKLQDALRRGTLVAVLMLDIDHFKSINDRYGHFVGDEGLKHVVAVLRSGVRSSDLLGRLGGEEFAIVLANAKPDDARRIAERLRGQIASTPMRHGENAITITVSIGLTMLRGDDRAIEQLLTRADARLYAAKAAGRNRVRGAETGEW